MNLLKETEEILKLWGKSLDDITCVFGDEFQITIDNFIEIAKRTDYDDGYGLEEIATDLIVAGKDFWLERHEYDGSEWWEFKEHPTPPTRVEHIDILSRRDCAEYYGIGDTLKAFNFGEEDDENDV